MASVTLAESAKLTQNDLISGVIEDVISVNPIFQFMPFRDIEGNALSFNRENALGAVEFTGVGSTISAGKAAATFTNVTSSLTTIVGDAEVNGLIQATRSKETDQAQAQISSKAKSAGREFQDKMITGTGASNQFTGLINLCASGQKVATGTNGGALSFDFLDELLDLVIDKDGQVDYILMPKRTIRAYKALHRGLGGTHAVEAAALQDGSGEVLAYSGVPIFRNDYIPVNQTKGSSTNTTTIFAGTWDDGSGKVGMTGITAPGEARGLRVVPVGESEDKDEFIWRVKWYCGMALFNEKGLACAEGITN